MGELARVIMWELNMRQSVQPSVMSNCAIVIEVSNVQIGMGNYVGTEYILHLAMCKLSCQYISSTTYWSHYVQILGQRCLVCFHQVSCAHVQNVSNVLASAQALCRSVRECAEMCKRCASTGSHMNMCAKMCLKCACMCAEVCCHGSQM